MLRIEKPNLRLPRSRECKRRIPVTKEPARRAFTLIELLVVIAIIAILAGLLLPAVSRAMETGRTARCVGNVRQMGVALQLYTGDYGYYPALFLPRGGNWPLTWMDFLIPYSSQWKASDSIYKCPSFKFDFLANNNTQALWNSAGPYGYNGNHFASLSPGSTTQSKPAFYVSDSMIRAPSQMIALGDTHIQWNSVHRRLFGNMQLTYQPMKSRVDWPGYKDEVKATKRRHAGFYAVGFCDGHVEKLRYERIYADDTESRRIWNRDHEPFKLPGEK